MLSRLTNKGMASRSLFSLLPSRNFGTGNPTTNSQSANSPVANSSEIPDEQVLGPGNTDANRISTVFEQASGAERIEYLAKLTGKNAFLTDPLRVDHYGTLEDPILVESVVGRRLAGCTGFPKYSHEPLWLWVDEKEPPARCQECGQAFKINKIGGHHH